MHEVKGAELAAKFLTDEKVDPDIIEKVKSCIMATHMPQQPKTLIEQILCDADLFHFGNDRFSKKNKLMHEEYNNLHAHQVSDAEWDEKTITLLESHHYFTDYGKLHLNADQEKNIKKLKHKLKKEQPAAEPDSKHNDKTDNHPTKVKNDKKERPERGIETMFRISSNNHSRLSDMADNKAHILITVNSIILSAVISLLLRKLDNNEYLAIPSFILLLVSLITMVFAILATRPKIPNGVFTSEDITEKKVNLLFFGNFYKMGLEAYREAMLKVMDDHDFLYDNLIRDVYSQGVVLGRKYYLLRIAYSVFMFGLIVAVVAFIIATITGAHPTPKLVPPKAMIAGLLFGAW
jgi:pycsar effector protein